MTTDRDGMFSATALDAANDGLRAMLLEARARITARDALITRLRALVDRHDNTACQTGVDCPTCGRLYTGYVSQVADGVSEAEHLERVERQREQALATTERVQALHRQSVSQTACGHCWKPWPCPTIRALEQPSVR